MQSPSLATDVADISLRSEVEAMRALFGGPALSQEAVRERDPDEILTNPRIAIIDDQVLNIKIVTKYLKLAGYQQFFSTVDARQAIELIEKEQPDVVFLDIMMPFVSGLDILEEVRRNARFADLPVIVLTAATEKETKLEALRLGATEFLHKPIDSAELPLRLRNVLAVKAHQERLKKHAWELEIEVAARSKDLTRAHREVVQCLATVGEYRDNETGKHIIRVGKYSEVIATHLGMDQEFSARIRDAAPLHDIGKVGIPDRILLKPGKLDNVEFEAMKHHCKFGALMCAQTPEGSLRTKPTHTAIGRAIAGIGHSPILKMAATIAYTHHERWDGSGYPQQLKGADIPIEGRITSVADVFDALTQQRPYKPAFPLEKALEIIRQQSGSQFDPAVVEAFFAGLERIIAIYHECGDTAQDSDAAKEEGSPIGGPDAAETDRAAIPVASS
jgi:putative two-component system response regulator